MIRRTRQVLVLAAALGVAGCSTGGTQLLQVWQEPGYDRGPIQKVLVIGLAKSDATRRLFESRLANAFQKAGTGAQASYELLPSTSKIEKSAIENAIAGQGFDAVLVTNVVSVDKEEKYVPGTTTVYHDYWGGPYYRSYYPYYAHSYDVVHSPGYMVEDTIVKLETNVYSIETESLLWATVSETLNPDNVNEAIDKFARVVITEMKKTGLVK